MTSMQIKDMVRRETGMLHHSNSLLPRAAAALLFAYATAAFGGCSGEDDGDESLEVAAFPTFDFGGGTDPGSDPDPDPDADEGEPDFGGEAPECCSSTDECGPESVCAIGAGNEQGECIDALTEGQCFADEDCPEGQACDGALFCDCSAPCDFQTGPGACQAPGLPEGCCATSNDCDQEGTLCVALGGIGTCENEPSVGTCWADPDCGEGLECKGAVHCSCGDTCDEPTHFGLCEEKEASPDCVGDDECPDGTCVAAGGCGAGCPPGDPSCCDGSYCIELQNECLTGADCESGICEPGAFCPDYCTQASTDCCIGNTCYVEPCKFAGPNPQGCFFSGCGLGETCDTSVACVPSSCECNPATDDWQCVDDCAGGQCVASACPGPNPQGCKELGCPVGHHCEITAACVPSLCACDSGLSAWACSADCDGGVCVAD